MLYKELCSCRKAIIMTTNTESLKTKVKSIPSHILPVYNAVTEFVVGLFGGKSSSLMEEHKDELMLVLKSTMSTQKVLTYKKFKDPNAPKKGKSSYIYFCIEQRAEITKNNPDMSAKDIIRELGRVWREETTEKDKVRYTKMSLKDKEVYEEQMKSYVPPVGLNPTNAKSSLKVKNTGPKRGLSSYIFFCKENRSLVKEENPDLSTKELTSELGKKWREMEEEDRVPYKKLAELDKIRYESEKESLSSGVEKPESSKKKVKKTEKLAVVEEEKSKKKSKHSEKEPSEEEPSEKKSRKSVRHRKK
jgi:hypothetical protein